MLDDFYALRDRARVAAAKGGLDEARTSLLAAASQVHVAERDYVSIVEPLADVLLKKGDARGALTVDAWYAARSSAKSLARARGDARERAARRPRADARARRRHGGRRT